VAVYGVRDRSRAGSGAGGGTADDASMAELSKDGHGTMGQADNRGALRDCAGGRGDRHHRFETLIGEILSGNFIPFIRRFLSSSSQRVDLRHLAASQRE